MKKITAIERMNYASTAALSQVCGFLGIPANGLSCEQANLSRQLYGGNTVTRGKKTSLAAGLFHAFINPFTAILMALAAVSASTDIVFAAPGDKNPAAVIIIVAMVAISGLLRFVQETKSGNAAAALSSMIRTTVRVIRRDQRDQGLSGSKAPAAPEFPGQLEIPLEEIVVGDLVRLSAGDMIPADLRICQAKDLFVNESSLTGESEPVEKTADAGGPCIAWLGSSVVSGSATALVIATGDDTLFGQMAKSLTDKDAETSFEKGVNSVSWVLIRFMLLMVPIVFLLNGITKGDWLGAGLFAISVAVGLTPEMLPMIVTASLAGGAVSMAKERVIVKKLNAIQDLGAADLLCTDKTGTLTCDRVALEYHLNVCGREDLRVLRHAFLNSFFQTGLKNHIDVAVMERTAELEEENASLQKLPQLYRKVDEIPFDFQRRRMSVVVSDHSGKTQMITKGAVEEILTICSFVEYLGEICPLTDEMRELVRRKSGLLNNEGMRVIAVAQKTNPSPIDAFSVMDERDMVLIGYLAFLDPPKDSAASAIASLAAHGVTTKILTGDNEKVSACICRQVGIPTDKILLGPDIALMDDETLIRQAEDAFVFARLTPAQKSRIVTVFRKAGHTTAFMGDGINDAAAMKAADVGISVDTAVDVAKETADIVLLEKDLTVLTRGIVTGRKTYANMIKYIKITASSNFGNVFSVLAASAFLPFLPMAAIQLILLNLIYDVSCTAMPWDNVDADALRKPRKWDASGISRFMLQIGPISSLFDIATFLLLYFLICPTVCGGLFTQLTDPASKALYIGLFQAGWFIESMWSQTLVIHMLRTPKLPFLQSKAAAPLTLLTCVGIAAATAIPFTSAGVILGLSPLPAVYFLWLFAILAAYMVLATAAKNRYTAQYGQLL